MPPAGHRLLATDKRLLTEVFGRVILAPVHGLLRLLSVTNMWRGCLLAWLLSLSAATAVRAESPADASKLFEKSVATVLSKRCLSCHGAKQAKGGLSLATKQAAMAGGESGPAIVPGKPDESLVIAYISGDDPEMPKGGPALAAVQVAAVREWIAAGAAWPDDVVLKDKSAEVWWSLSPLVRPEVPPIDSLWIRTPIDAFVLAKLEELGLPHAAEADRRTLIRRLTFDLHGLPPTPEDVQSFLADDRPGAYERLVDRLLDSPRYGERWGRHWLDIVHYGESHGYDKDKPRTNAWPYRDYVIDAFNADKPYSRFVLEQLAGDVLFPGDRQATIATGFVAAGPWDFVGHVELREGTVDKAIARSNDRDDMVMTAMSTFVSMTVHCARCHDHKFDPIAQEDYYRLQAVFAGVDRADRPCPEPETACERESLARELADVRAKRNALTKEDVPDELKEQITTLEARLAELNRPVFAIKSLAPRPIHLLRRGDVNSPGLPVAAGALACVSGVAHEFVLDDPQNEGARRAALAHWFVDSANVLARRSIVNRVWQYHFGAGLVDTPNDFGAWARSRRTQNCSTGWPSSS